MTSLILSTKAKLANCSTEMDDKPINLWEEYRYPCLFDVCSHSVQLKLGEVFDVNTP